MKKNLLFFLLWVAMIFVGACTSDNVDSVSLQKLDVDTSEINLLVGGTHQISVDVDYSGDVSECVKFSVLPSSSNYDAVTIDESGLVTGVEEGECTIVINSTNGNLLYSIPTTVSLSEVVISKERIEYSSGTTGQTETLTIDINYVGEDSYSVIEWSSLNEGVASVDVADDGYSAELTVNGDGATVITVTAPEVGAVGECYVFVGGDDMCTVTFDTQGAFESFDSQSVYKDLLAVAPTKVPTKDDCIFLGWFTEPDCSVAECDFSTHRIKDNTTLYACWWDTTDTTPTHYYIPNVTALELFRTAVNDNNRNALNATLTADIDLSSVCSSTLGVSWTPIGTSVEYRYCGTFDGDGHKISGLYMNGSKKASGLFAYTGGATFKNLTIFEPDITNSATVTGALIAYATTTMTYVTNCTVEGGSVKGNSHVGGFVGIPSYLTMTNCHNVGTTVTKATSGANCGGLVGQQTGSTGVYKNCSNSGNIVATVGGDRNGGLVGGADALVTFENCSNSGDISIKNSNYAGGLVGYVAKANSYFKGCSNSGNIIVSGYGESSPMYVAGIAGGQANVKVLYYGCSNGGNMSGYSVVGGIVGNFNNSSSVIAGCYNKGKITVTTGVAGGIVGNNGSSYSGSKVYSCYNAGVVSSEGSFGAIGGNLYCTLSSCYYLSSLTTISVGSNHSKTGATGVSTISDLNSAVTTMNSTLGSAYGYKFVQGSDTSADLPTITTY